jgi:hypothetical protein
MRRILFIMPFVVAIAGAQTMTEVGASAAGSAVGSAAGRRVSDGISAIFGKVDKATAKAATPPSNESRSAPLAEVAPGMPKVSIGIESVPPPPPVPGARRVSPPKPVVEPMPEILPPPPPPPPPPPQVTAEDLKTVTHGMTRQDVLKLGAPASRITMSDEGHLFETFSYAAKDASIGRVKLVDGAVSSVEVW